MPTDCLSYSETHYFSPLICDYLAEKEELKPFYHRFPEIEAFKAQLEEKQQNYPKKNRKILVRALQSQYRNVEAAPKTLENIAVLEKENTFTVTTGHQLNLFTGPLYFLYKIISTLNLCSELQEKYPDNNFVPVYWMATEDHDFEEINFFNLHGKKFQWNSSQNEKTGGAVGELPTDGLESILELFSAEIGNGIHAESLKNLFKEAYIAHSNLSDATLFLANKLFGEYGLVILDAQQCELKDLFVPIMERELTQEIAIEKVLPKAEALQDLGYTVQVNPREINLFYLEEGLRERIIKKDGDYFIHGTEQQFSEEEILKKLHAQPEKFSPNVMLRPLYQEVILPNLCYIGGGGELAYWLELKDYFEAEKVVFPILLLRNSALLVSEKQDQKLQKLDISNKELFLKQHELINQKVRQISNIDIDFSVQKEQLKNQFQELYRLAEQTDKSFLGAVKAQEVKQIKGLEHLEKRLLKAQKYKLKDEVSRVVQLQNQLFPNQSLQERQENFAEYYLEYGTDLIPNLLRELNPLEQKFKIIRL